MRRPKRSTEFVSPTWYRDWAHALFATVAYKAEGKPSVTRLYCSTCEKVFFEGVIRSRRDRLRFKVAEGQAMEHHDRGDEVVFVTPERVA